MDNSFVIRKFQRSIAGLSLLAILASFAGFGTAFASSFPDVSSDYFAYDQIDALSDAGVMTGNDDGTFAPDRTLNRAEAAKVLLNAFGIEVDTSYDAGFSDVADGMWYTDYVNTAAEWSIVDGYSDGTYRPATLINRAEFAKMVVNASGLDNDGTMGSDIFSDVNAGAWYDEYVGTMYVNSVTDGTSSTTYSPASEVSRGAAAKMTYNSMYPVYRGDSTGGTTGSSDATVTVEVSNDTPVADTIPSNATSVELASFDFTAEGDDSMLDALTVHQYGISSTSQMTVYLYEGSSRLTSGTSVNSTSHESDFRNLNLDLPEGETVTLTVRADMGDWTSSGEVGFEVESADMVDVGDSSVEGDFPAMGEKFSVSTTDVGSITVEKNGTVDNADVGEDDAYVAKFKLTAGSVEGGSVQELGLYLAGTISTADVENFRLYISGDDAEPVAQVDTVDDLDVVRFVFGEGEGVMDGMSDGYALAKGESKSFYVLADFNTGRTGDTVQVYVDQSTDVKAVGDLYGYGLSVTRTAYDGTTTACTSSAGACSYQTLQGGDITVSSNGPSATDVAINGKDVILLNFVVTSVTDVTFDNFPVALTASESSDTTEGLLNDTAANFTDIKIVDTDTGEQVYSSVDATSLTTTKVASGGTAITEAAGAEASTAYYVWTDDWEIDAGSEYNLALKTDIANTSTLDSMTIVGVLPFDGSFPALKDSNNKALTNSSVLVPTSSITGKTMTVKAPSLTLSLASTPSGAQTFVKGAQDVQFTGIVFACGQSSDCRITDMTVQGYYDDDANGDWDTAYASDDHTGLTLSGVVGSIWLEDGSGNEVASAKSVNSTTYSSSFQNMDWTVDAGETEILYVVGDISSNATTQRAAFGISSTSNVTVENVDGNSFTPTNTVNTTPSTYVTVTTGGTLTVSVASSTAREDIAVAGSDDVEISSFDIAATREDFVVKKLSLNNRQSAATTAALGDYDDNVVSVKISYENSDGDTETSTAYLVNGTADFSGLDIFVPKGSYTTVTAYATLNDIITEDGASSPADAATFVDLAMAFDNFEALAGSSGDTYKASNLDAGTATLSIGTITWTNGSHNVNSADVTLASLGSAQSLTLDDGAAGNPANLPVGTLLCVSADTTCSGETIMVVTGWTEGSAWTDYDVGPPVVGSGDTVTTLVVDNADTTFTDGDNIVYALPGTGYFTGTNQMVVYESKPTVALASSSPTGTGYNTSTTDEAFVFTVTADANEKVQMRAGVAGDDENDVNDVAGAIADGEATITTTAGDYVDGSGGVKIQETTGTATGSFLLDETYASGVINGNDYVSFWFKYDDPAADSTFNLADISLIIDDDTTPDTGTAVALNAAGVLMNGSAASSTTTFTENVWAFFTVPISGAVDADGQVGFAITDSTRIDDDDEIFVDALAFHNEMLFVDLTSDADFNLTNAPVLVSMKESGTTVAQGTIAVKTTSTAGLFLVPGGVSTTDSYTTIDIAKSATKTFKLVLDTQTLLDEDSGVDDPLTFAIDLGTSSAGTVTPGDFWWYETNAVVRWLGDVSSSTISGSHSY